MTRRHFACWFAGCLLSIGLGSSARAQQQDAFCDAAFGHDMQLFAPVDFDFECQPIRNDSGFFFNYNKLGWSATGERTTIGSPGLTVEAERIVRQGAFDIGIAPEPYVVQNGIQNAPPRAEFSWGDRYELGYFKGGNGWMVGILDGPKITSFAAYGFNQLQLPNTLPISNQFPGPTIRNPNFDVQNLLVNGAVLSGSADIPTSLNGFGSVHVNFETAPGYLDGFRDYWGPTDENNIGAPTIGGPGYVVTQITRDDGLIQLITVTRDGDGIIDDINGNGIPGFGSIFVIGPDGDPIFLANFVDYEDLHTFNVRFDALYVRNITDTSGVEIMRTHDLDNSYMPVKEQRNRFTIGYGARFLRINDNFAWEGRGDWIGRTFAYTNAENQIVGPQIRAKWMHQRGRIGFDLDGRFVAGYNVQDLEQEAGIGENLSPGRINRPLYAQPTYSAYGSQDNNFSPVAELRAEVNYQLTSAFALKLGYTAIFADNITRASQIVRYRLPDMGITSGGKQNILVNGFDFGVEAVY